MPLPVLPSVRLATNGKLSDRLSQMSRCPEKTDSRDFISPEHRLLKSPEIWNYDYPMTGYGTVCMPDDSNKAWGMLFESEAWPPPNRVKQNIIEHVIDILFDSKSSQQHSASAIGYASIPISDNRITSFSHKT